MESISSSETAVDFHQTTQRDDAEGESYSFERASLNAQFLWGWGDPICPYCFPFKTASSDQYDAACEGYACLYIFTFIVCYKSLHVCRQAFKGRTVT
jgi:hypothetical protein